jgi:hypothetical protein
VTVDAVEIAKRVHARLLADPLGLLPPQSTRLEDNADTWALLSEITRLHNRVLELHGELTALKAKRQDKRKAKR